MNGPHYGDVITKTGPEITDGKALYHYSSDVYDIIEVKTSRDDLQRAVYQLAITRINFSRNRGYGCGFFWLALYDDLESKLLRFKEWELLVEVLKKLSSV
jgi:hypothetical protein